MFMNNQSGGTNMDLVLINKVAGDIINLANTEINKALGEIKAANHNQAFYTGAIAGIENLLDRLNASNPPTDQSPSKEPDPGKPVKASRKKTK
jgi:hypothetical protein